MKMFNKIRMQSEFNTAMLFDGLFYNGTATAEVEDGACVAIGDPINNNLYDGTYGHPTGGTGSLPAILDLNANKITAYAATADIVGIVDFVGVNQVNVQNNMWKIGDKIAGIPVPAGTHTRVRLPQVGDEFYLGDENISALSTAPVVGNYLAPEAGKTTWKEATNKAASGLVLKVLDKRQMIQGSVNNGVMYRVRVIQK